MLDRQLHYLFSNHLMQQQKHIKTMCKGGSIKVLINKFFIYESVPSHNSSSYHYKNMIIDAQQAYNYRFIISVQ